MSQWFKDRRQEFIAATLHQFGQINRADIMRQFDVSQPQASADISAFLASDPPRAKYDVSAKCYVACNTRPIPSTELIAMLDDPDVKSAIGKKTRFA